MLNSSWRAIDLTPACRDAPEVAGYRPYHDVFAGPGE